jgi:tRNA(adenine34) deaminase
MSDSYWMQHALTLAKKAEEAGEVPVGALIIKDNELIAEGWNQPISSHDATAHAEVMALRSAGEKLSNYRLLDTELFVTLEPCPMCVGAMLHARVKRVVFAATDPKTGALGGAYNLLETGTHNHVFEVKSGVLENEASDLLRSFFKSRR